MHLDDQEKLPERVMNALQGNHLAWQDRALGGLKALETFKTMDLPALRGWRVGNNGPNRCFGPKKTASERG
jgi:hypothetical protein